MRNGGDEDNESTIDRICAFHAGPGELRELARRSSRTVQDSGRSIREPTSGRHTRRLRPNPGSHNFDRKAFWGILQRSATVAPGPLTAAAPTNRNCPAPYQNGTPGKAHQ